MKKILDYYGLPKPYSSWHKFLLTMKITVFLFFCGLINLIAGPGYSQNTKISLNMKDVSVGQVLNKIEEVSEFYFLFNQNVINTERKVYINEDNQPIKDILSNIFDD